MPTIPDRSERTRRLTVMAMVVAVAYVLAFVFQFVPAIGGNFLKYDPKSVMIAIGAFLYGPVAGLLMAAAVALLELITFSDTGLIGFVMNILTTAGFACVASLVYTRRRTVGGAVTGLSLSVVVTTGLMLLWNYLITPLYMHVDRAVVAAMLPTVFLPFNLLQGVANMALTLMLYTPLTTALRASHLLPVSGKAPKNRRTTLWVTLTGAFLLVTAVLVVLVWNGIL